MHTLLTIPLHIQLHIVAALAAVVLGLTNLARRKGGNAHRTIGWMWIIAMVVVTVGSFWIKGASGRFSWIHLLSVGSLVNLALAVYFARVRNFKAHKGCMIGGVSGLLIAGAFTLLPGRIMYQSVFG
jgi:uncharacterized membrane protein